MREHALLWLVVIGLAGSLVSVYYYLVIVRTMFVDAPAHELTAIRIGWIEKFLLFVLGTVVLVLGLFPDLLLSRIQADF
jgi:NADH:ubiquinone oxidoreductase subunit 2 (subunit N)